MKYINSISPGSDIPTVGTVQFCLHMKPCIDSLHRKAGLLQRLGKPFSAVAPLPLQRICTVPCSVLIFFKYRQQKITDPVPVVILVLPAAKHPFVFQYIIVVRVKLPKFFGRIHVEDKQPSRLQIIVHQRETSIQVPISR